MKDELKKFESTLDHYHTTIGLDKIIYNDDVDSILLMSYDQLKNLDKQGCDEYAFLLTQYSLVISKEYNRNKVRVFWANDKLNRMLARYQDKYIGDRMVKYEIMRAMLINNDTAAEELNSIIMHATARMTELENITNSIDNLSRILHSIGRSNEKR